MESKNLSIRKDYASQLISEAFSELEKYKTTNRYHHYMQACEKGYFAFKQYVSYLYDKNLVKPNALKKFVPKNNPVYASALALHYLSFGSPDMADYDTVKENLMVIKNFVGGKKLVYVKGHEKNIEVKK